MSALLKVEKLHASYGSTRVLHGIDFEMEEGSITALLGANGAGKTTTLRAVSGMVKTEGAITLAGQRIDGKATEDIVRMGVAHVPDGRGTFTTLTTEENLRLGAYARKDKSKLAADFELIYNYFPRLKERRNQQAGTLSGGEQQMLAVSRALMLGPRLLLLDEPSFGLAPLIVREIFRIMQRINQELIEATKALGGIAHNPFMSLSFLALPVIPTLKLTDRGLVDVDKFDFVPLFQTDEAPINR